MRDRIKTYVGVLRDNTAIVASVALFFLWLGITFQVPDFAVDGTFEPGLVAPWIVVAFCYALGTSLPFCGTAKSRLFFCGEDSSFLCALLWQQV